MLRLQYRIMLLTVLPMLLVIATLAYVVKDQTTQLADAQASLIEERFLAARRDELANYVHLATTAINHLQADGTSGTAAQERAKSLLRDMDFGNDGYFFVYDMKGVNLVHPRQPELVGKNLWELRDPQGIPVVQGLIRAAQAGGGYFSYMWEKPSNQQLAEKLGYAVSIPRYGWMMGTGLYLDDVERTTHKMREDVAANIHTTMQKLAIIAAISVLVMFAGGIMLNVSEHRLADHKQKELTQRIVTLQEEERSRVARELHDGISQLLVSVKFQFELVEHKLESGDPSSLPDLRRGLDNLSGAIGEVRRISHDLRPTLLDDLGLASALEQLLSDFGTRTGIDVTTRIEPMPDNLAESSSLTLFRIVQEGLTNIERHAHASQVEVALCDKGDNVILSIHDNGVGFNVEAMDRRQLHGIGLRNMRERVEYLGGSFQMESQPGSTMLTVNLPSQEA
ncbi:MAG TPA: cache domain-containing protein [Rhodocyclaceae bacterium]|nr:cache domain-containing protein [Rhodocyclaceae bacterium]